MTEIQVDPEDEAEQGIRWDRFRVLLDQPTEAGATTGSIRRVTEIAAGSCWIVALVVVFLTWNGAAERRAVGEQIPFIISGGLTSILLTVMGGGILVYGAMLQAIGQRGSQARDDDGGADTTWP